VLTAFFNKTSISISDDSELSPLATEPKRNNSISPPNLSFKVFFSFSMAASILPFDFINHISFIVTIMVISFIAYVNTKNFFLIITVEGLGLVF